MSIRCESAVEQQQGGSGHPWEGFVGSRETLGVVEDIRNSLGGKKQEGGKREEGGQAFAELVTL